MYIQYGLIEELPSGGASQSITLAWAGAGGGSVNLTTEIAPISATWAGAGSASVNATSIASTTLDPANTDTADLVISGGNLIATGKSGGSQRGSSRSTTSHTSGKYYFESRAVTTDNPSGMSIGLMNSSQSLAAGNALYNTTTAIGWKPDGTVVCNNVTLATIQTLASTHIGCVAVDIDASLIWFRSDGGNWNNSPTANPATGTEGITVSFGGTIYAAVSLFGNNTNNSWTMDFGGTAFAQAAPAGFAPWAPADIDTVYATWSGTGGWSGNFVSADTAYATWSGTGGWAANFVSVSHVQQISAVFAGVGSQAIDTPVLGIIDVVPPATPVAMIPVGTAGDGNSGAANTTTVATPAPAGSLIIVSARPNASNQSITAFRDSVGNVYTCLTSSNTTTQANMVVAWAITRVDVPAGTSFTATTSGGASWTYNGAWYIAGVNNVDKALSGTVAATSTGTSQATGALARRAELIFAQAAINLSNTVYTPPASFTNLFIGASPGTTPCGIDYKLVSSNATVTWAPTWTSATVPTAWQLSSFVGSAVTYWGAGAASINLTTEIDTGAAAAWSGAGGWSANVIEVPGVVLGPAYANWSGVGSAAISSTQLDQTGAAWAGAGGFTISSTQLDQTGAVWSGVGGWSFNLTTEIAPISAAWAGVGGATISSTQLDQTGALWAGAGGATINSTQLDRTGAVWAGVGGWSINLTAEIAPISAVWAGAGGFTTLSTQLDQTGVLWSGAGGFIAAGYQIDQTGARFSGVGGWSIDVSVQLPSGNLWPIFANWAGAGGWSFAGYQIDKTGAVFNGAGGWTVAGYQINQTGAQFSGAGGWSFNAQDELLIRLTYAGVGGAAFNVIEQAPSGNIGLAFGHWAGAGSVTFASAAPGISLISMACHGAGGWSALTTSPHRLTWRGLGAAFLLLDATGQVAFQAGLQLGQPASVIFNVGQPIPDYPFFSLRITRPDGSTYSADPNFYQIGEQRFNTMGLVSTAFFLPRYYLAFSFNRGDLRQAGPWTMTYITASNSVSMSFVVEPLGALAAV